MNQTLTVERFDEFFAAVNGGHSPFPWQRRLLAELFSPSTDTVEPGTWPGLLALPTGSGKTSAVDVAVYALAMGLPVPRRIFFVVDRRVIVQQAAAHARKLADLLQVGDGIVADVAKALRAQGARTDPARDIDTEVVPLRVAELRGAIEQDRTWAMRPDQPTVVATTVDQLGSRLLFRGYGVSDKMLGIHAGLVGNDALILLDEVHLSQPFAALLATIRERFRGRDYAVPDRWQVVELSATPSNRRVPTARFALDDDDYANPTLQRRLNAHKPARLVAEKYPADSAKAAAVLVASCVQQALDLAGDSRIKTIAVVVNRVRTAARIAEKIAAADIDTVLLTGRMREWDKHQALEQLVARVSAGTERTSEENPLVVVATQTIEAGADFDFDVLVTECASIDALIQRFGRVDRLGNLATRLQQGQDGTAADPPMSVIIGSDRLIGAEDPIYGAAMGHTWQWLRHRDLDFGIKHLELPDGEERSEMSAAPTPYPRLLASHLNRLVRTSPKPDADVDIAPFLHGFNQGKDPDVEIVWRADLSQEMLEAAWDSGSDQTLPPATAQELSELLAAVAPSAGESLAVPLSQARVWLRRNRAVDRDDIADRELSDIEGIAAPAPTARGWLRPILLCRGDDSRLTTNPADLRPGDTIVVPGSYGGINNSTWDPDSEQYVTDLALETGMASGRLRLRLNPAVLEPYRSSGVDGQTHQQRHKQRGAALLTDSDIDVDLAADNRIPTPGYVAANELSPVDTVRDWLRRIGPRLQLPASVHTELQRLAAKLTRTNLQEVASEWGPVYVISSKIDTIEVSLVRADDIDSEPGRSSNVGAEYGLDDHLGDVARWAQALALACGMPSDLANDLARSGELHDLGKSDPRFQAILREGALSLDTRFLAKSAIPPQDRARAEQARAQSGYPRGLRHELASLALVVDNDSTADPLLVRHLITSHHGYARPFAPAQIDEQPVDICYNETLGARSTSSDHGLGSAGSEVAENFWNSVERYGHYGLAWLETLLRLADHGASRSISDDHRASRPGRAR